MAHQVEQAPSLEPPAPDPEPEPDPVAEAERAAAAESELIAPKIRMGGMHSDLYPGEVGPCTRCGWVWTPSAATLRRRAYGIPKRCANCRTDAWQDPPLSDNSRQPGDKEFLLRRDTIANRKHRRQVARLKELASTLNVKLIGGVPDQRLPASRPGRIQPSTPAQPPAPDVPPTIDLSPQMPWQQPKPRTAAIPPPPGMEDGK